MAEFEASNGSVSVCFRPKADAEDPALVADEVFLPSGTFRVLPAGRFSA